MRFDPTFLPYPSTHYPVYAREGMVSSPQAAAAGLEALRAGGRTPQLPPPPVLKPREPGRCLRNGSKPSCPKGKIPAQEPCSSQWTQGRRFSVASRFSAEIARA
jgi:hypothetical protein